MNGLQEILDTIGALINTATPIVVALALLYFLWGVGKYVFSAGDGERQKEGQNIMVWGIIALTVMVSVWGLVQVLADTFDVEVGQDLDNTPGVNL
ncbi:MAG: hypothetical protein WDZ90_00970 [Candidatus Paceibacterota bacterium]